jgi:hypothetical protein
MSLPWRPFERPLVILAGYMLARLASNLVIHAFAFYDHVHNFVSRGRPNPDGTISYALRTEPIGDWLIEPSWGIYALIIIAECSSVRRLWLYVVCGAVAIGTTPWLFILRPDVGSVVGSVYGLNSLQFAAAGCIGGLVYWLITVKWGGRVTWSYRRLDA